MALAERRIRVAGVGGTPGEGFAGLGALDEVANLAGVSG
jgi:hypothetical protein